MTSVKRRESTTFLIGKLRHFVVAQKAKTLRAARDISRVWRRGLPAPRSGIGGASGLVRSEQGRNPREHAEKCAAKWKALLEDSPTARPFPPGSGSLPGGAPAHAVTGCSCSPCAISLVP